MSITVSKKPKSALAMLLDNVSQGMEKEEADVGAASIESHSENESRTYLNTRIEKKDRNNKLQLQYIKTNLCKPWECADRPENEMGDIDELAESIQNNGQQEPILVRPRYEKSGNETYEIIFGNRRWRACKKIDKLVWAIIKEVNDENAALYQKEENENREELSLYAKAKSYKLLINRKVFANEVSLSKKLGISPQFLNDIMAFNRIPQRVIDAIPNVKNLSIKTAKKIAKISKNKECIEKLISLGQRLSEKAVHAGNLEKEINSGGAHQHFTRQVKVRRSVVNNKAGNELFTMILEKNGGVCIKINKSLSEKYSYEQLQKFVSEFLEKL